MARRCLRSCRKISTARVTRGSDAPLIATEKEASTKSSPLPGCTLFGRGIRLGCGDVCPNAKAENRKKPISRARKNDLLGMTGKNRAGTTRLANFRDRRSCQLLAFSNKLAATGQIYIPDERFGRKRFHANFAFARRTGPARPHDTILGLLVIALNVNDLSRFDRAKKTLDQGAFAADVLNICQLAEWVCLRVDAPDAYG